MAREGIRLATGETVRLDLQLDVSGVSEAITVTGDAPLLRSETSSLGQVIDNRRVVDLPLDLAILRRVAVTGSSVLELRAEVFNATNTPPLGPPNTTVGAAALGAITTAGDPRVIQLAVKFIF